jgi:hypothetical protein
MRKYYFRLPQSYSFSFSTVFRFFSPTSGEGGWGRVYTLHYRIALYGLAPSSRLFQLQWEEESRKFNARSRHYLKRVTLALEREAFSHTDFRYASRRLSVL